MQLMNLSFTFADGIAAASTSLVGQNLGKKRPDLSIMYGKIGQRFALLISLCLCAMSILNRFAFPALFSKEASTVAAAAEVIFILGLIQPVQTTQIVMAGSLRGAGDTRFVAITMLLTATLLRPTVSLLFIYGFGWGLPGAWYSIIVDQLIRLVLLYSRFSRGKWISIKV
jgi:Na+-driven multidrug efflux pump